MNWPDRKLSDDPEMVREHMVDPDREVRSTSTVEAPCCGRQCAADMVCHVPGEGWACDACRAALRRDPDTDWTRPRLMRAMGAPPVSVRREYVKKLALARYIEAQKKNRRPLTRQEFFNEVDREVEEGAYPTETQPPV